MECNLQNENTASHLCDFLLNFPQILCNGANGIVMETTFQQRGCMAYRLMFTAY